MAKRHYISITEVRSIVIAVDGADSVTAATNAVVRAYRNGDITLNHGASIVEDKTVIRNETKCWADAVKNGYNDSHFKTLKTIKAATDPERHGIDRTKSSNIKCEHCERYCRIPDGYQGKCGITGKIKNYWNRCKQFEWRKDATYKN